LSYAPSRVRKSRLYLSAASWQVPKGSHDR